MIRLLILKRRFVNQIEILTTIKSKRLKKIFFEFFFAKQKKHQFSCRICTSKMFFAKKMFLCKLTKMIRFLNVSDALNLIIIVIVITIKFVFIAKKIMFFANS